MSPSASGRPRLVLLDGHSLIYRAFFALPGLSTAKGEITNAVYGFTSMLILVLAENPEHLAVCLDRAAPTFRSLEMEQYKAQRKPMPDDLRVQMQRVREVIEVFNLPIYELDGFEADDLIGTLARQATAAGLDTTIVTGDLDALQLVDDHTSVFTTRRGITDSVTYGPEQVRERYGLDPSQMVHFKALKGDTSDNIPGVPGVGDKTAARLLQEHGDLEGVITAIPEMAPGRLRDALEAHVDQMRLALRMATIDQHCPIELDLAGSRYDGYDFSAVKRLFDDLEFKALLARLPEGRPSPPEIPQSLAPVAPAPPAPDSAQQAFGFEVSMGEPAGPAEVVRAEDLGPILEELASAPALGLHLLTEGRGSGGRLFGIGLSEGSRALFVPTPNPGEEARALEQLRPLLTDPAQRRAGHDLKQAYLTLAERGIRVPGWWFDTYIAAHLTGQGRRDPALELLARDLLGLELPSAEEVFGRGRTAIPVAEAPLETVASFAGNRALTALRVAEKLEAGMQAQELGSLFADIEMPLINVLGDMEMVGVQVDMALLASISAEVGAELSRLEQEIWAVAGYEFNPNSTQKLAKLLYEDLQLPTNRRIKTGYSTDAATLEGLRDRHPVVATILEYRFLSKLRSTYLEAFPQLVAEDGRIHTSYNQTGAATGRLSSSNPNLQNIPIRTELGRRIRAAFIPGAHGDVLVSADYSQIELRVLAHMCEDPRLIEAFESGHDIHQATAAAVFKVPFEDVSGDQRRAAKVVNFGLLYGMGESRLARDMGMTLEEARGFIQDYFGTFARVRGYLDAIREEAQQRGFVYTVFHRRRLIPDIHSPNRQLRAAAERMAINMPIQGTAADIMKMAMVRLQRELPEAGLRAKLILSVHDELVLEVPRDQLSETQRLLREVMSTVCELRVPLAVDVNVGPNWGQITPVEDLEEAELAAELEGDGRLPVEV